MLARDGLHEAAEQNAWSKIKPLVPNLSMVGVRTTRSPKIPACFDQSSAIIKRMFGFLGMFWPANGKIERLMKSKISPFLIMGVEVFIFEELRR